MTRKAPGANTLRALIIFVYSRKGSTVFYIGERYPHPKSVGNHRKRVDSYNNYFTRVNIFALKLYVLQHVFDFFLVAEAWRQMLRDSNNGVDFYLSIDEGQTTTFPQMQSRSAMAL